MDILLIRRGALVCFLVSLFVVGFCSADSKTFEVVGVGECADCAENNFETSQAFSGLRVTIDCKTKNGVFETRGSGELDKEGNFKVFLPENYVKDDKLKEDCYAQLHSASADACPSHGGLESSKIIFKYKSNEKHHFGLKGKLKFSPVTCASATFWKHPPLPKWNHPPLPTFPFHHHHHPLFPPIYKKPNPPPVYEPPPVPVYKKPNPPPVPVYKPPVNKPPPVPVYKKPCPPPVPTHKKPHPPPVPVYKKPLPPTVPVYNKPHPPPVPVYKKPLPPPVPVYKKPLPPPVPTYKPKPHPPIPYKPLPPIPKLPCPPFPKTPPKYFHHHKFGKWPPLPPLAPHHP